MDGCGVDIMTLDLNDINVILADTFFNGDTTVMGLVLYTVVLAVLFGMKRHEGSNSEIFLMMVSTS